MKIFLNYRRDDSMDVSGRIYDRLAAHFGTENVFKDVDSIPPGVDFRHHIRRAVSGCDVFLAVIGADWLLARNPEGICRLNDEADFVRLEIAAALERKPLIIPLLVRGASMPRPGELPAPIRDLAFKNAVPIRSDPDFHRDISRLIEAIEKPIGTPRLSAAGPPPMVPAGANDPSIEPRSTSCKPDPSSSGGGGPALIMDSGAEEGREFPLTKDRMVLGRGQNCDIVLSDFSLARNHAQLIRQAEGYLLEDLGSKNGTYINGVPTAGRTSLREGDRLHLGKYILIYRSGGAL